MVKRKNYRLEYPFKAKAELIYSYISIPYNLASWFADDVKLKDGVFIFSWQGSKEKAKVVKQNLKKRMVFKWLDREGDEHLTFEIETDDITGGTVLIVSDYDDEDQIEGARLMWDTTIDKLKNIIGG
jgi:uncharacterized protein YndB with AHSA1/START domain